MTKKDFIRLADHIRESNRVPTKPTYTTDHCVHLANWLALQNPQFDRERWLGYVAGTCGPNGGAVKT